MIHVEFKDASEQIIVSVYAGPQDPAYHPFMGTVERNDPRLLKFLEAFDGNGPYLPEQEAASE